MNARKIVATLLAALTLCAQALAATPAHRHVAAVATGYIVEANGSGSAAKAVRSVGGRVTRDLPIIDGVAAQLTSAQAAQLRKSASLSLFADGTLVTQGGPDAWNMPVMGVDKLHAQGINGTGVTVAVIDTGVGNTNDSLPVIENPNYQNRVLASYDAIANVSPSTTYDTVGHGTHVTSIIMNSDTSDVSRTNQGIAPWAKLVWVRAFGANGTGSYSNVISGLNWILANKAKYNIRVLNLSFGTKPQSFYWNDPIDQAVMKLWQAGVVVVASAGNSGPGAQSISVPGNTPYVITVGAMTDNFTPGNTADDGIASFSSAGPTYEGFVKPDVVAPGGHMVGLMDGRVMSIAKQHPEFSTPDKATFTMSGTSQAAAAVSGTVALMLQANPTLTPNQVKCRLISSAASAVKSNGSAAYSIFQQGAGLVNAYEAVYNQAMTCANQGLDISKDVAGTAHYGGPAHQDPITRTFYVIGSNGLPVVADGYLWNQGFAKLQGYLWNNGYLWNSGYLWNNGYLWNQGYLWNNGYLWSNGYLWNQSTVAPATSPTATESWNAQE
jgi:serine protease AprX